jgi:hypothetical protein
MRRTAFIGLVVVALAGMAGAQEAPQQPTGQKRNGFALETHIGTEVVTLTGVGNVGLVQGGLFAGYKIDRFILGLGFDLARVATGTSQPGGDTSQADTVFLFVPGLRVAIVRSKDERVELFGQFDLGLGTTTHEESPTPNNQPNRTRFNLSYQIGPGVRFWAHPQFAIGALVGVRGDFAYEKDSTTILGTTTTNSTSSLTTSIFGALQLMGVF